MSHIKSIRERLGVSQAVLADAIGVTQGNVSHYERAGQVMPPHISRRLIDFARHRGVDLSYDDIYGELPTPEPSHA